MLVWLSIQLVALLIPAAGWKYAATERFPNPPELVASQIMAITQLIASSLLFPYLLRNWATAIMVILVSWPMTMLSTFLGGQLYNIPILKLALYVTGWLVALSTLRTVLRTRAAEMTGVAIVTGWVVGSAALSYLHAEYGPRPIGGELGGLWENSPLLEIIPLTRFRGTHRQVPWLLIFSFGIAGVIAVIGWMVRHWRRGRVDKLPQTYPQ